MSDFHCLKHLELGHGALTCAHVMAWRVVNDLAIVYLLSSLTAHIVF